MSTDSFVVYIKTEDIYLDIAKDAENRFVTSNYKSDIPLAKVKNKKVIGLMKDDLGRKRMTKLAALGSETHSAYLFERAQQ